MTELITFSELINAAIAAEDAAQKIYLAFKSKFLFRPDVANFWQTMADDDNSASDEPPLPRRSRQVLIRIDSRAPGGGGCR